MEIKMSKFLKCILMTIVVVSMCTINIARPKALHIQYTNYFGIEMTDEEYLTLLNLGFDADEIYYMNEETFEANKDLDATLITRDVRYYKMIYPMYGMSYAVEISEQEYLNQGNVQPLDTVTTLHMQIVSTISQNGSKYRYKVSGNWLNIPDNKSYDVIGIGFNDDVYINSNVYFNYTYYNSDGSTTTSTVYYDKKSTSTGGSVVYKIPTTLYGLSASLYYDVSKNTDDTITLLTMCGDYAHSTVTVTSSQAANHYIHIAGIDFDSSVSGKFNSIPCAMSYAAVNW